MSAPAPETAPHVLVVDDDATLRRVLADYLVAAGFEVTELADGPSGLAAAMDGPGDLMILDLSLPGLDGLEVFRRLRSAGRVLPVVMVTARGEEVDRILGLEIGADDYVAKPCSPREVVLRVQSVLRRTAAVRAGELEEHSPAGPAGSPGTAGTAGMAGSADAARTAGTAGSAAPSADAGSARPAGADPSAGRGALPAGGEGTTHGTGRRRAPSQVLIDGDLSLDLASRTARRGGEVMRLTSREFDLLFFLLEHPGDVLSRTELLRQVWGWEYGDESTVTVHVRRLREKVEADPSAPKRLVTVWGHGYAWEAAQ